MNYYINEETTNIITYKNKILLFIKWLTSSVIYHNKYLIELLENLTFKIDYIKKEILLNLYSEYKFYGRKNPHQEYQYLPFFASVPREHT